MDYKIDSKKKYVGKTARFKKTLRDALGDVSHLDSKEV